MNYINDWGNQYQPKTQTWKDLKEVFKKIESWGNYRDIVKAIVSYEKAIEDDKTLDKIYERFMESDCCSMFSDNMEDIIEGVEEEEENR